MEALGSLREVVEEERVFFTGTDSVAVGSAGARIMGFDPENMFVANRRRC